MELDTRLCSVWQSDSHMSAACVNQIAAPSATSLPSNACYMCAVLGATVPGISLSLTVRHTVSSPGHDDVAAIGLVGGPKLWKALVLPFPLQLVWWQSLNQRG